MKRLELVFSIAFVGYILLRMLGVRLPGELFMIPGMLLGFFYYGFTILLLTDVKIRREKKLATFYSKNYILNFSGNAYQYSCNRIDVQVFDFAGSLRDGHNRIGSGVDYIADTYDICIIEKGGENKILPKGYS